MDIRFKELSKISEAYSLMNESYVQQPFLAQRRVYQKKIIQVEKTIKLDLSERYGFSYDSSDILEKMGIDLDNGFEEIGYGAGRLVYSTPYGTVLKIASDSSGIMQNIEEYRNKSIKNRYGCFPYLYWISPKGTVIEEESISNFGEYSWTEIVDVFNDKFESITGIKFTDYWTYLLSIKRPNLVNEVPKRVVDALNYSDDIAVKMLKNLYDYIKNHNEHDLLLDIGHGRNWGITLRRGKDVIIPLDVGINKRIVDKYYNN